ncbi:MAG: AAA family ATPase [Pseudoxanthomonas sp.]
MTRSGVRSSLAPPTSSTGISRKHQKAPRKRGFLLSSPHSASRQIPPCHPRLAVLVAVPQLSAPTWYRQSPGSPAAGVDSLNQGTRNGEANQALDPLSGPERQGAGGALLADLADVRLLIVDPVVSAVGGDSHKNAEVRRSLQPLVHLAQEHGCALLGITHFSKGTSGRNPVERLTGSLAFAALARLVMVTARTEAQGDEPARQFLARAKANHGPSDGGFAYDLRQMEVPGHQDVEASFVLWGEALEGSAAELLAAAETHQHGAEQGAVGFLRTALANGERAAKEVFAEAARGGFSKDAMNRAKRKLGVTTVKSGMAGGWTWRLAKTQGGDADTEDGAGGEQTVTPSSQPSVGEPRPS